MDVVQTEQTVVLAGGALLSPIVPDVGSLDLGSLARGLAGICRFNGATPAHYSVAQHSVLVARCALLHGGPRAARAGLVHDLQEALIGDMVWPLKRLPALGAAYRSVEEPLMAALLEWLEVDWDEQVAEAVDLADRRVLLAETRDFFGDPDWAHSRVGGHGITAWPSWPIVPMDRAAAYEEFMRVASGMQLGGNAR